MGLTVGSTLKNSGHEVLWASRGRSDRSMERARKAGFVDVETLRELSRSSEMIVSVCPPEFAMGLAAEVTRASFQGLYADVNAISPGHKLEMSRKMESAGIGFTDGGIIGLPVTERGKTWLYLSGPRAAETASYFTNGPIEVEVLGEEIGRASGLKMCYAGFNKASIALVIAILAAAREMSVLEDLKAAWTRTGSDYIEIERRTLRAAPKAWRWAGEMREIASTLRGAGLPEGFHQAAEEIYERLRALKDAQEVEMSDVLGYCLGSEPGLSSGRTMPRSSNQ